MYSVKKSPVMRSRGFMWTLEYVRVPVPFFKESCSLDAEEEEGRRRSSFGLSVVWIFQAAKSAYSVSEILTEHSG